MDWEGHIRKHDVAEDRGAERCRKFPGHMSELLCCLDANREIAVIQYHSAKGEQTEFSDCRRSKETCSGRQARVGINEGHISPWYHISPRGVLSCETNTSPSLINAAWLTPKCCSRYFQRPFSTSKTARTWLPQCHLDFGFIGP